MDTTNTDHKPLSLFTKIIYGTGDLGIAGWGTLRQIFYAIFLTDVVGLEARLASFAALIGVIWDAITRTAPLSKQRVTVAQSAGDIRTKLSRYLGMAGGFDGFRIDVEHGGLTVCDIDLAVAAGGTHGAG